MRSSPQILSRSETVVSDALAHLARIVLDKGRFIYAHEAGDTATVHDGYNLLRHCGTLWFMARAANRLPGRADPDLLAAIGRATSYIGRKLAPPPWAATDRPSLGLVGNGAIKLGGLGLGLLARPRVTALEHSVHSSQDPVRSA